MRFAFFFHKIVARFSTRPSHFFLFFAFFFNVEYFILGPYSVAPIGDNLGLRIPQMTSLWHAFREYGFCAWWPQAACGYDGISNNQLFLHLLHMPYAFLPAWMAFAGISVLECFLAGYYTFRLVNETMGCSKGSGFCAGLISALLGSGFGFGLGISGFPLFLFYFDKAIRDYKGLWPFIWAIIGGILFSLGAPFMWTMFFFILSALYWIVFIQRALSIKSVIVFFLFSCVIVIIQIPDLWAFLLNGPLSHRAHWDFLKPYFGGGLSTYIRDFRWYNMYKATFYWVPLMGLFTSWRRREYRALFIILVMLIFLPAAWYPIAGRIKEYIGPFRSVNMQYFHRLIPFFLSFTVGYVLEDVSILSASIKNENRGTSYTFSFRAIAGFAIICCTFWHIITIKIDHAKDWIYRGSYVANLRAPDVERLSMKKTGTPFRIVSVNKPGARDWEVNYSMAYGLEAADGYLTMHTLRYQAFWGQILKEKVKEDIEIYSRFYEWGNRAELFLPKSFQLRQNLYFEDYFNLNLLSLANVEYLISLVPIDNEGLTLLPDLKIRQKRSWTESSFREKIKMKIDENFHGKAVYIYKNEKCFPRFFLVDKVLLFDNTPTLLKVLGEADAKTLREKAFILSNDWIGKEIAPGQHLITLKKYSQDQLILNVETEKASLLIVTNNYSPFWHAFINDQEVPLIPAYNAFMAVYVSNGNHTVVLKYSPPYFYLKRKD